MSRVASVPAPALARRVPRCRSASRSPRPPEVAAAAEQHEHQMMIRINVSTASTSVSQQLHYRTILQLHYKVGISPGEHPPGTSSRTIGCRATQTGEALTSERRAVVVLSGGLDSTTMGYLLRTQGYSLAAISLTTGSGTARSWNSRSGFRLISELRGRSSTCTRPGWPRSSAGPRSRMTPSPFPTGTTPTKACGSRSCRTVTQSC